MVFKFLLIIIFFFYLQSTSFGNEIIGKGFVCKEIYRSKVINIDSYWGYYFSLDGQFEIYRVDRPWRDSDKDGNFFDYNLWFGLERTEYYVTDDDVLMFLKLFNGKYNERVSLKMSRFDLIMEHFIYEQLSYRFKCESFKNKSEFKKKLHSLEIFFKNKLNKEFLQVNRHLNHFM